MELPELHCGGVAGQVEDAVLDARPVEITCAPVPGAIAASLSVGAEELGAPATRLGEPAWRWEWHPRGRVGAFTARLTVVCPNEPPATREYTLTVAPGKLEQAHYSELLVAIQRVAAGLVYALDGGAAGAATAPAPGGPGSLIEEYWTRLAAQTALACAITRALARGAPLEVRYRQDEQELAEVAELQMRSLARFAERPLDEADVWLSGPLARLLPRAPAGKPRLPRSLPVRSVALTNDCYEHRLLARIVAELGWRCDFVREALTREVAWRSRLNYADESAGTVRALLTWRARVDAAARALQRCRTADILTGVVPAARWQGPSERMRRDRRYRQIGRLWRMLHERPFIAVQSPVFDLPVNDLPSLYEQWCLLEVARALEPAGALIEQQLLRPTGSDAGGSHTVWRVRLAEDRPLIRRRRLDGTEVALYYRRRFRPHEGHGDQLGSLDPFLRIPDIVVEMVTPGRGPRVLVFDAKYRLAPAGGIPEEALADAYTYHSAIGYAGAPASAGVFLLFPGAEGFEAGDVGAIPLLPGRTAMLQELVERRA